MRRRRLAALWWMTTIFPLGGGCSAMDGRLGLAPTNATRRRFMNVESQEVFIAAERALREEFRIDVRRPGRGYLKSLPKEVS